MPSADQLRSFADSVPTLAWSAVDGAAESFNQRWLDYTGLSASEGSGAGWKAVIHPDDLPRLLDTFQRARESCEPFEFEGRLRAQRAMSKRAGSTVVEAKGSHAVYVSQPRAVADLIAKAANSVALATQ